MLPCHDHILHHVLLLHILTTKKPFYLYQMDLSGADWSKLVVKLVQNGLEITCIFVLEKFQKGNFLGHSVDRSCHFDFPSAESWQRV